MGNRTVKEIEITFKIRLTKDSIILHTKCDNPFIDSIGTYHIDRVASIGAAMGFLVTTLNEHLHFPTEKQPTTLHVAAEKVARDILRSALDCGN
jgi:hypothetical protein